MPLSSSESLSDDESPVAVVVSVGVDAISLCDPAESGVAGVAGVVGEAGEAGLDGAVRAGGVRAAEPGDFLDAPGLSGTKLEWERAR